MVRRRLDVSSRKTERSVGSVGLSRVPSEVRRMDLRATLRFFTNMRKSALPYSSRRRLRAWRIRRRVAFPSPLNQSCAACRVVVSIGAVSGRRRIPRESTSLGCGLRTLRRDIGLLTMDQSGRERSTEGDSSRVPFGVVVSCLLRWRMALARRRISETSWRTNLG